MRKKTLKIFDKFILILMYTFFKLPLAQIHVGPVALNVGI